MLSMVIDRSLMGLVGLELEDPVNGLTVVRFGPGQRTMRLEHATSPVSDGSILVGATADLASARLTVRAFGIDEAQILARVAAVEAALNQWAYTISVTVGGHSEQWRCQPANHARGATGTYDAGALRGGWQDLSCEIPHQPITYAY